MCEVEDKMLIRWSFLGSFLDDWWNTIRIFFHEMNPIVKTLVVTLLFLLALLCFIRIFQPMYKEKKKFRLFPIIGGIISIALASLIIFI